MIDAAQPFGRRVARARKALGLTQRDLALAIGAGERFIVELEAGKPITQLGKALAAAKAAGMRLIDAAGPDPPVEGAAWSGDAAPASPDPDMPATLGPGFRL
ncbi:MAG TPA: helix-turn-helix domain-containing protein [Caulobacteraceae bacterium]|jgi:transcriptional regulator with XRE-family HTH domain|nr:helix-turn-helix domain-containing protein [Caulobacteraceae bacterium]